jgi:NAD(P)-dependent dehydrogenase (short-subunit alcohol dehydrogenase family)
MRLQNRKVIITDAARRFGNEVFLTFAKESADVFWQISI